MTLDEFLKLFMGEELRVELEIDEECEKDYLYTHFWLSDYKCDLGDSKYYSNYKVVGYDTVTIEEDSSEILIRIKK